MAWLWDTYEEFLDYVQPILVAEHAGPLHAAQRETLFEHHSKITEAVAELRKLREDLSERGFENWPPKDESAARAEEAYSTCQEIVWHGEELILYHRRLAKTPGGQDFIHEKNVIELSNWSRYVGSRRIFMEIRKLIEAVDALLSSYGELASQDEDYLPIESDLPDSVLDDFRKARDLLSVGMDEIGLLIAGRGLEATLRHIAKSRGVTLEDKGKSGAVSEAEFFNLIEVFRRLRWRGPGVPLLDKDGIALLHYLRSIRNAGAHPVVAGGRKRSSARELSKVTVEMACSMWQEATKAGARLVATKVTKDW